MFSITLIATAHKEVGLCNSNELYKIIEQIAPEIIFEELSPNYFASIYEGSGKDSLESCTIKKYLQKQTIEHIPVDKDMYELIGKKLANDIRGMFRLFNQNYEYNNLSNQQETFTEQAGFRFLNSDHCGEIMERSHYLEEVILGSINNEKLSQTYKSWLAVLDNRRNEMIENIYSYSELNNYNKALFLVGTEHKKPIIDKLSKFQKNSKPALHWIFNYFS